jgi:integrase
MLLCALKPAVRWGLVGRNVTDQMTAPRRSTPETKTLDARQTDAILKATDGDELEAQWRQAVLTGMRRGEVLGLMWKDIVFERGALSVRLTLIRGNGGTWELGTPKGAASWRLIALPLTVVESLKRHRVQQVNQRLMQCDAWEDHDFVFTNAFGGPLYVNSIMIPFAKVGSVAGVPTIRFHDLRQSCATLLLAQNVHPKIVQERLGHANISVALDC